jgi:hypothetical protein
MLSYSNPTEAFLVPLVPPQGIRLRKPLWHRDAAMDEETSMTKGLIEDGRQIHRIVVLHMTLVLCTEGGR